MFNLPTNPNDKHKHDCHDHDHDHHDHHKKKWHELGLRPFDRIAVTIPAFFGQTIEGVFLSMEGNVLVWIADLPFSPPGTTLNRTVLDNGNVAKLS